MKVPPKTPELEKTPPIVYRSSLGQLWALFWGLLFSSYCLADAQPPNVLLVVADDLGYGDLGYLGSEIKTPTIDRLAAQGVRFADFHTAFTCSPTRAMLLTGVDSQLAGLGNMAEEMADNQRGRPGYEGFLNHRVQSLGSIFSDAGYRTFMTGKWHLGADDKQGPDQHGFDRSFVLLPGGASHFSDMKPAYAKTHGQKAAYREDGKRLKALPDDFYYSSQFYVDKMLSYLYDDKQPSKNETPNTDESVINISEKKPFFAYLAFTAPHWPLQAPKAAIDHYRGRYSQGYEVLHEQRLQKQRKLGLISAAADMPPGSRKWSSLSVADQKRSARAMEIYAAMITEMDRHLGRLLKKLARHNDLNNTIIVFMSDNGAEGHDLESTWPSDKFPKVNRWIKDNHNFDSVSMGKPDSYVLYGQEWAWASAPGFKGYKGYSSDGGSHVPALLSFPKLIKPSRLDILVRVKDIAPTLLELSNTRLKSEGEYHPISGRSVVPALMGKPMQEVSFVSELFGKRVVRLGDWKAVLMPPPAGNNKWQLFNIKKDRAEKRDLSLSHPKKLADLVLLWDDYVKKNNVILPNWVSGY